MARIFVSYSRKDQSTARSIAERLSRVFRQYGVFYDAQITGGEDWWTAILARIAESDVFVYLVSDHSLKSYACRAEFLEAMRLGKRIVPVLIQRSVDMKHAPEAVAFILSRINWIELPNGSGDDSDLLHAIQVGLNEQPRAASADNPYLNLMLERDLTGEQVNLGGTQNVTINYLFDPNTSRPVPQPQVNYAQNTRNNLIWLSGLVVGVVVVIAGFMIASNVMDTGTSVAEESTPTTVTEESTEQVTAIVTEEPPTATQTRPPTATRTDTPTRTPTEARVTNTPTREPTPAPFNEFEFGDTARTMDENNSAPFWVRRAPNNAVGEEIELGAIVTIEGGPIFDGTQYWWQIRTASNQLGWIEDSSLEPE